MKKGLLFLALAATFIPCGLVCAEESSPYLVGEWFLSDSFNGGGTTTVNIIDTQFTFLNPTNQTLFNEYAFFDQDGGFCGCDRDMFAPNGRIRYTMSAEAGGAGFPGAQFSCVSGGLPTKTEGVMKTIAFQVKKHGKDISIDFSDALQVGYQIHFFANGAPTESGLKAISVDKDTLQEMNSIHQQCVTFCNKSGLCPALQ